MFQGLCSHDDDGDDDDIRTTLYAWKLHKLAMTSYIIKLLYIQWYVCFMSMNAIDILVCIAYTYVAYTWQNLCL